MNPLSNPNPPKDFAHPIEAEFARLLDFYRIPWDYEPVTFPLEIDDQGGLVEAFTPDFYLPSSDLFVELTTQRQGNITDKHRKLRRAQSLYPGTRFRLLNRKQMIGLLRKFGVEGEKGPLIGDPEQAS